MNSNQSGSTNSTSNQSRPDDKSSTGSNNQPNNAPNMQPNPYTTAANLGAQQQLYQYYQQFYQAAAQKAAMQQQASGQGKPPTPVVTPTFPYPYPFPTPFAYYQPVFQPPPPPTPAPPPPSNDKYESSTDSVYISGLPSSVTEKDIEDKFGSIGIIKTDKKTREKKITLYKDKQTDLPKGDAMVTYEDPGSATAAISWFNGAEFMGSRITVQMAQRRISEPTPPISARPPPPERPGDWNCGKCGNQNWAKRTECNKCKAPKSASVGGTPGPARGRGGNNAVAEPGDWICPKPQCANVNFARRDVCNRCGESRPPGMGRAVEKREQRYERRDRPY